jgi:hypothetical protein
MPVPEFAVTYDVRQVLIYGGDSCLPHFEEVFVTKKQVCFPQVFDIGIDASTDT